MGAIVAATLMTAAVLVDPVREVYAIKIKTTLDRVIESWAPGKPPLKLTPKEQREYSDEMLYLILFGR